MSVHTPGPWRLSEDRERTDNKRQFIWSDAETREEREDGSPYCVATVNPRTDVTTLSANAKLIAAAPEMADATRGLLKAFRDCIGAAAFWEFEQSNPAVRSAMCALAKAGL
jgi:hypothetical protein